MISKNTIAAYLDARRKSGVVCMWCCHVASDDHSPMPLAVGMRPHCDSHQFTIRYYFCSLSCVLAYIFHERCLPVDVVSMNRYLAKVLLGIPMSVKVRRAPPRSALILFGGKLTIDEFRRCPLETRLNTTIEILTASDFPNVETVQPAVPQSVGVHNVDTRRRHTRNRDLFLHKSPKKNTIISCLFGN